MFETRDLHVKLVFAARRKTTQWSENDYANVIHWMTLAFIFRRVYVFVIASSMDRAKNLALSENF